MKKKEVGIYRYFLKCSVLCFIIVLAFSFDVEAASNNPIRQGATLTVTGIDSGDVLTAYQLLDIQVNRVTNELEYSINEAFEIFCDTNDLCTQTLYDDALDFDIEKYVQLTSGDITSGSTQTTSTLDKLMSDYASFISHNDIISVLGQELVTSGDTATYPLYTGSYLILPSKTNRIYAVMVANLDYKAVDGEWAPNDATIVAKVDDPYVKSWIGEIGKQEASFNIGEEYTYYVEAKVPQYPTNSHKDFFFEISSNIGTGIDVVGIDAVTAQIGGTDLIIDVIDTSSADIYLPNSDTKIGTLVLHDFPSGKSSVNLHFNDSTIISGDILISYKAKLNSDTRICRNRNLSFEAPTTSFNVLENEMSSDLGYYQNVYADEAYYTYSYKYSEKTLAHTYRMKVRKYDLDNDVTKLSGAVFDVYSDSSLTNKVGTITTTGEEYIELSGLGEGTYYLVETKAPTGYSLLKEPVSVEIKYKEDELDEEENYCGPVFEIGDSKVKSLPFTGGMGTILYTTIGLFFVVMACFGAIYYRRKNRSSV